MWIGSLAQLCRRSRGAESGRSRKQLWGLRAGGNSLSVKHGGWRCGVRVTDRMKIASDLQLSLVLHSPCRWLWMPCGRCGASEPASTTTSTPAPWRRGSTRWKTSSPSTSL